MRCSALACLVLVGFGAAASAQAQETLRWRYRAGDGWTYRVSQERRMSLEQVGRSIFGPQSIRTSELQTWTLEARVRSVDPDGSATVQWTIVRIQVSGDGDGGRYDWDSDRPEPTLARGPLRGSMRLLPPLVGGRITGVVTPRGELTGVTGVEALAVRVVRGRSAALAEQVRSMFEGDALRGLLMGGLAAFLEDGVVEGDSWVTRADVTVPFYGGEPWSGEQVNTWSHVASSAGERVAVIGVEATVEADLGDRVDPLFGPGVAEATRRGSAEFSLESGQLVRSRTETDFVRSMNVLPPVFRTHAVFNELAHFELVGPVDVPTRPVSILDEAPSGTRVTEALDHPGGITGWRLGNGVRVLLKPDRFEEDRIVVLGVGHGGTSLAADELVPSARAAVAVIAESGAGDFTPLRLQHTLDSRGVSFQPQISEWGEGIRGMAPPEELETLLRGIYLSLTSPRADAYVFEAWKREREGELAAGPQTTGGTFGDAWARLTGLDHPWSGRWTPESLAQVDLGGALAFYEDRFADTGDMVFNLVGPFQPTEIRPLVERYLGGLPAAGRQETWRDRGWRLPGGIVEETAHTDVDEGGNTRILFHGPLDYRRQEQRVRVAALGAALELRLGRALRTLLGEGRYVSVRSSAADQPYERYEVEITLASEAEAFDEAVRVVFEQVAALKDDGPSTEEADRVRTALRADLERGLRSDTYWSNALWQAGIRGEPPAGRILGAAPWIEGIDVAVIRDAARAYLDARRYVHLTLVPDRDPTGDVGVWLTPPDMQRRSDLETERGFYPTMIEGRHTDTGPEYRASFAAFPTRFEFRSNWGMTEPAFEARDAELAAQGFTRIWRQDFTEPTGAARVQTVWVRRAQP